MAEIAGYLQTTHATVLYWLKRHGIARRSQSESAYVKQNPAGDPFRIPAQLSSRQQELLAAGLLLYWAEGTKTTPAIQLVNLDSRVLQLFAAFLREVCGVDERRLRVYVRLHEGFSVSGAQSYWSRVLKLPPEQVFVYPHRDRRSEADKQRSAYGIATLQFSSVTFKRGLNQAIEDYIMQQLDGAFGGQQHGLNATSHSFCAEPEAAYDEQAVVAAF
jgi:hypothetical protein